MTHTSAILIEEKTRGPLIWTRVRQNPDDLPCVGLSNGFESEIAMRQRRPRSWRTRTFSALVSQQKWRKCAARTERRHMNRRNLISSLSSWKKRLNKPPERHVVCKFQLHLKNRPNLCVHKIDIVLQNGTEKLLGYKPYCALKSLISPQPHVPLLYSLALFNHRLLHLSTYKVWLPITFPLLILHKRFGCFNEFLNKLKIEFSAPLYTFQ